MTFRWPEGHFYSTIPNQKEISSAINLAKIQNKQFRSQIPGYTQIDENIKELLQKQLNEAKRSLISSGFYPRESTQFVYADALMLRSVLNELKPLRIIEVGSGHSSAVLMDYQKSSEEAIRLTLIEPYPERLEKTIGNAIDSIDLRKCPVQEIDRSIWDELEAGDFLFIDSSHVVKAGSDVAHLFFEVLPNLRSGVVIHIHDIFHNFEYPEKWFLEGRFWNEAYILRAFLLFNSRFKIRYWPSSNKTLFRNSTLSLIDENLEPGSSIYIVAEC